MRKLEEVLQDWEAVIGLEIHAELTTLNMKMFCGCKLEFGADPNTHTCPVCLGLPGALPVPNKAAIESIVLAGLATNCDIEKHSMFYRKNYMYPDMAKNFQTTQGPVAFCMRGHLDLDVDGPAAKERGDIAGLKPGETCENVTVTDSGYTAHVGITRIHMEEDAGKMIHQIAADLEKAKQHLHLVAAVDDLKYLRTGGRLSAAAAVAGGMLGIKPILAVIEGKVALAGKARGLPGVYVALFKKIDEMGGIHPGYTPLLGYTVNHRELQPLLTYLQDNLHLDAPLVRQIGCVIGTHTGPGAFGIAFFDKELVLE